MSRLIRTSLLAVAGFACLLSGPEIVRADYWNNYWRWYDNHYTPYYRGQHRAYHNGYYPQGGPGYGYGAYGSGAAPGYGVYGPTTYYGPYGGYSRWR